MRVFFITYFGPYETHPLWKKELQRIHRESTHAKSSHAQSILMLHLNVLTRTFLYKYKSIFANYNLVFRRSSK